MAAVPSVIQEDIEADALSADACVIGAVVAFGTGVGLQMSGLGGMFPLVSLLSLFATVFLFIFFIHFYRRARAAAEEFHSTAHQMMWDHWMATMPATVRWVAPSRPPSQGPAVGRDPSPPLSPAPPSK